MKLLPPTKHSTRNTHVIEIPSGMRGASGIIEDVAVGFRYRRSLSAEVRRELIRFSALHWKPVFYALRGHAAPYALFGISFIDQWLDAGGRTWILAEMEARSGDRVVPFVRKNGGAE